MIHNRLWGNARALAFQQPSKILIQHQGFPTMISSRNIPTQNNQIGKLAHYIKSQQIYKCYFKFRKDQYVILGCRAIYGNHAARVYLCGFCELLASH